MAVKIERFTTGATYICSISIVFLIWLFKLLTWGKALPHVSHLYGFSPVWILKCWFKLLTCEKALPHVSHLYGFSPVCIKRWRFKLLLRIKDLPQVPHIYDLLPLCLLRCLFKLLTDGKPLLHVSLHSISRKKWYWSATVLLNSTKDWFSKCLYN